MVHIYMPQIYMKERYHKVMGCFVIHIDETDKRFYELMLWDRKKISLIEDDLYYPRLFDTIKKNN